MLGIVQLVAEVRHITSSGTCFGPSSLDLSNTRVYSSAVCDGAISARQEHLAQHGQVHSWLVYMLVSVHAFWLISVLV